MKKVKSYHKLRYSTAFAGSLASSDFKTWDKERRILSIIELREVDLRKYSTITVKHHSISTVKQALETLKYLEDYLELV
ncbi:MAG: hypothetical protein AABY22_03385 [Nanoarchaeota archaeon]